MAHDSPRPRTDALDRSRGDTSGTNGPDKPQVDTSGTNGPDRPQDEIPAGPHYRTHGAITIQNQPIYLSAMFDN